MVQNPVEAGLVHLLGREKKRRGLIGVWGASFFLLKPVPFSEESRTSGAKALINPAIYGTAEAVPFV
jgi:hypothetical protein